MAESNTAAPIGDPNAGENSSNPNMASAPAAKPKRTQGEFNKAVETELSKSSDVFTSAEKPEYAQKLAKAKIDTAFVTGLVSLVEQCGQQSQAAVVCDNASQQATQNQSAAERELMGTLRTIQGAARQEHLPENPALLGNYLPGERLGASRPMLVRNSEALIARADDERPGVIDTAFITDAQAQRKAFVDEKQTQGGEGSKAAQGRAQRDALLEKIVAGRKKIQYAADTLWPAGQPESVQARKDFKLPANRPYSY